MKKFLLAIWEDLFKLIISMIGFGVSISVMLVMLETIEIRAGNEVIFYRPTPVPGYFWLLPLLSGLASIYFLTRCTLAWRAYLNPTQPASTVEEKSQSAN